MVSLPSPHQPLLLRTLESARNSIYSSVSVGTYSAGPPMLTRVSTSFQRLSKNESSVAEKHPETRMFRKRTIGIIAFFMFLFLSEYCYNKIFPRITQI